MSAPYVRRSDISYNEDQDYDYQWAYGAGRHSATGTSWTAEIDGSLSTGERVSIRRIAPTRQEAANALAEEIAAQGWEIK